MRESLDQILLLEAAKVFAPLRNLRDGRSIARFASSLGWRFDPEVVLDVDLQALVGLVETVLFKLSQFTSADTDAEKLKTVSRLGPDILRLVEQIRADLPRIQAAIENAGPIEGVNDVAGQLPRRLFNWLVHAYLATHRRRIFAVMSFLGIAEALNDSEGMSIRTIHWDRLGKLLSDPAGLADDVYAWNRDFESATFLARLHDLLRAFAIPGGMYLQNPDVRSALQRADGDDQELRIPIFRQGTWPAFSELDLNVSPVPAMGGKNAPPEHLGDAPSNFVSPVPAMGGKNAGLVLYPHLLGGLQIEQAVAGGWQLRVRGRADFAAGFGVELRTPREVAVSTSLFAGGPPGPTEAHLEFVLSKAAAGEAGYLFGTAEESHVSVRNTGFRFNVSSNGSVRAADLSAEVEVSGLELRVAAVRGDGFIQKVLGEADLLATCDLCMGWSTARGTYFRGSGALELEVPVHERLGPVNLASLFVGIDVDGGIEASLAATLSVGLGPISVVVQKIGFTIPISFRSGSDGNLGPLNVQSPQFRPPTGAGLSIDAGPIIGGGFLAFDRKNERYSGILGLHFGKIGLTAIALITTKMPDGSKGFSLTANIGVTFDPAIQIAMGFWASGFGGLLGANRTMDVDVLRAGLKNHTLDSILFPDPATIVVNAPKIISDSMMVFPPRAGRYVVGPMVQGGWGPGIVKFELGIFMELPAPIRMVLLGQAEIALPKPDDAVVIIRLDILGVVEPEKKQLTFQATLFDSWILDYPLSGDSACLVRWGDNPEFVISMGGFHPKFQPPEPTEIFGNLDRLELDIGNGSDLQLSCQAYQALTTNSLQFGAQVNVRASGYDARVKGDLGFDALLCFSPFSFEASMSGSVEVEYKGYSFEVELVFVLSGPTPWNTRGKLIIDLIFGTVNIPFNYTWGRREKATLRAIDPWRDFKDALAARENWGSVLPPNKEMLEILAPPETDSTAGAQAALLLHPAGRLEVRQAVAPLGLTLAKVGNVPITGHHKLEITRVTIGRREFEAPPAVNGVFARGQFEFLSAAQQLSTPSFEQMPAGVSVGASDISIDGAIQSRARTYKSIWIGSDRISRPSESGSALDGKSAQTVVQASARARLQKRSGMLARFRVDELRPTTVAEERYRIVHSENMTPEGTIGITRAEAERELTARLRLNPAAREQWLIVSESELEENAI